MLCIAVSFCHPPNLHLPKKTRTEQKERAAGDLGLDGCPSPREGWPDPDPGWVGPDKSQRPGCGLINH